MVSALGSGSGGPGSIPGGMCYVLWKVILLSWGLSSPRCIDGYRGFYCWG